MTALENAADQLAAYLQRETDERELGRIGNATIRAFEQRMTESQRDLWRLYREESDGWDGEPWFVLNGLLAFAMLMADRMDGAHSDAFWGTLNGMAEREAEARAFLAVGP